MLVLALIEHSPTCGCAKVTEHLQPVGKKLKLVTCLVLRQSPKTASQMCSCGFTWTVHLNLLRLVALDVDVFCMSVGLSSGSA